MRNPDEGKRIDFTAANRVMWNETADVHARLKLADLLEKFRDPDFNLLDATERAALLDIGVQGKDVAQLSCNNGRELLCVERLGAARCVGFDISDAFIEQGRQLATAAGSTAEFVATDVFDISRAWDASFDIVYVTIGALGWLPDLGTWYQIVARLLRPGGHLVVYEMHPILDMFDPAEGPVLKHSYFRTDPFFEDGGQDYYDPSITIGASCYWFHHKLTDVIGGALGAGLQIRRFEEFPHDLSNVFRSFAGLEAQLPLSYLLVAQKQD